MADAAVLDAGWNRSLCSDEILPLPAKSKLKSMQIKMSSVNLRGNFQHSGLRKEAGTTEMIEVRVRRTYSQTIYSIYSNYTQN